MPHLLTTTTAYQMHQQVSYLNRNNEQVTGSIAGIFVTVWPTESSLTTRVEIGYVIKKANGTLESASQGRILETEYRD